MIARVRLATGRPETGISGGADIARVSGHSDLMLGLSTIANLSSNTKTPAKLVEYAQPAAAVRTIATNNVDARLTPIRRASGSSEARCAFAVVRFRDATLNVIQCTAIADSGPLDWRWTAVVFSSAADRAPDSRCALSSNVWSVGLGRTTAKIW